MLSIPVWFSEPPQNNVQCYYGVGIAQGKDAATIEKAKLRALQDLSSRLFITIDSTQTETRNTTQRNTLFGSYKDEQQTDAEIKISSFLYDIPGISIQKIQVESGNTFCLVSLDRTALQDYYWRQFESLLGEMKYLSNDSRLFNERASSMKSRLNKARNLNVPVYKFECEFYALQYAPRQKPQVTIESRPSLAPDEFYAKPLPVERQKPLLVEWQKPVERQKPRVPVERLSRDEFYAFQYPRQKLQIPLERRSSRDEFYVTIERRSSPDTRLP